MKEKLKKALLEQKRGAAEIVALILYIVGVSVIVYFHEPWFDECQAWLIARSSSVKDILFTVEHYEGHPPLWHLILLPFTRLGTPFKITLYSVNIVISAAVAALVLFKSPFPRAVRCLIPFSYFFFYQYGVLARSYSLMAFFMLLMAATYKNRNEKPAGYVISMALLCSTSLYGIAFAGAFALVWVAEIFADCKRSGSLWENLVKRKSCWWLLGLLLFAVFMMYITLPVEDTYYAHAGMTMLDRLKNCVYFLYLPIDSTIGSYLGYYPSFFVGELLNALGGALILAVIIYYMYKNKKLATFLVPYVLFSLFASAVYVSPHHFGLFTVFLVVEFWIVQEDPKADFSKLREKLTMINSKIDSNLTRGFIYAAAFVVVMQPVFQSAASSYLDIVHNYEAGYDVAMFIKENGLEDKKIIVPWAYQYNVDTEDEDVAFQTAVVGLTEYDHTEVRVDNTDCTEVPVIILPYFDENIIMNHNIDKKTDLYMHFRTQYDGEVEEDFQKWHDEGLPEVMIASYSSQSILSMIYSEDELTERYVRVATFPYGKIFKYTYNGDREMSVYIREDLLGDYPELHEIEY